MNFSGGLPRTLFFKKLIYEVFDAITYYHRIIVRPLPRIILELVRFRNLLEESSHSDSIEQSRLGARNGPL